MRIDKLNVRNFIGVPHGTFEMDDMTVFAGPNYSGKTSLVNAIMFAFTGQPCRGVAKKKDLPMLVTDGAKRGEVIVHWQEDGLEGVTARSIPNGKHAGVTPTNSALPLVLDMHRFSQLSNDERQDAVFRICNTKTDLDDVKKRATARGCDPEKVDKVGMMALSGFDVAHKEAAARATEAKGAWRAHTKDAYGPAKAEAWSAPVPVPPESPQPIEQIQGRIAVLDEHIAEADASIRNMSRAKVEAEAGREHRAKLAEDASKLESVGAELDQAIVERDAAQEELDKACKALESAETKTNFQTCPHCQGHMVYDQEIRDMIAYVHDEDVDTADRAQIPELKRKYSALGSSVVTLRAKVDNLKHDLMISKTAEQTLNALQDIPSFDLDESDLGRITAAIAEKTSEREVLNGHVAAVNAANKAAKLAHETTTKAARAHEDVKAWGKVAQAFAPDGIPLELTSEALKPFNASLGEAAAVVGWKIVQIRSDMSIMAGGRLYQLLSESEKWRADAMLTVVIARLSGLGVVLLDRIDVLAVRDRPPVFRWLYGREDIQSIVLGTFKQPPVARDGMAVHWLGEAAG